MKFTKMQGLGNDYLYVFGEVPDNAPEISVKLSDRHFGAGSDGMIYISSSKIADYKMRIFNADGSEAKMCGNGIRCVGKYLYDKHITDKKELTIETLSGIKKLVLHVYEGSVESVTVDMGQVVVSPEKEISVLGENVTLLPVDMGNPHAVIFVQDAENAPLTTTGASIEKHPAFPGGVNVEFVQVIDKKHLRMRVWERGSGITMACGTGTCATVAAAIEKGYCDYDTPVLVDLDGGQLCIEIKQDKTVFMTGTAEFVYDGEPYGDLRKLKI